MVGLISHLSMLCNLSLRFLNTQDIKIQEVDNTSSVTEVLPNKYQMMLSQSCCYRVQQTLETSCSRPTCLYLHSKVPLHLSLIRMWSHWSTSFVFWQSLLYYYRIHTYLAPGIGVLFMCIIALFILVTYDHYLHIEQEVSLSRFVAIFVVLWKYWWLFVGNVCENDKKFIDDCG